METVVKSKIKNLSVCFPSQTDFGSVAFMTCRTMEVSCDTLSYNFSNFLVFCFDLHIYFTNTCAFPDVWEIAAERATFLVE